VQATILVGGTARNDAHHLGVFVLALQHRADPLQGQRHADLEVLHAAGVHERGVRVVHARHHVGVDLEGIVGRLLVQPVELGAIALDQQFAGGLGFLAGHLQAQQRVLHAPPPIVVGRGGIRQPGFLVGVDRQGLGLIEIELRVAGEVGDVGLQALRQALLKAVVDLVAAVEGGSLELVVEPRPAGLQGADITGQQVGPRQIQPFQIEIEQFFGKAVVQLQMAIMALVQGAHELAQGVALGVARLCRRQRPGRPRKRQNRERNRCGEGRAKARHGRLQPARKREF
jgi:hypothetical protein